MLFFVPQMDQLELQRLRRLRDEILSKQHKFDQLSARERDLLRLRFGLDDEQFRAVEVVAQLFGVSLARVRLLEEKALRKLREPHNIGPGGDSA
jgi:DNA-directed RNA polymerase sigma subunit (sigma70/sigma32)